MDAGSEADVRVWVSSDVHVGRVRKHCFIAIGRTERGDSELAYRALDRATADDPKYSLTLLLRRVFGSGWPAAAFAAMRVELHPKVTAGIFES